MKNLFISVILVSVLGAGLASAQAPQMIAYQGLLTDNAGAIVADGDYSLTFRVFDAETGGTELWSETQPSVAVGGGLFKVPLGSVTPLALDFDAPTWLEVQVGADPAQSPRIALTSVPYSYTAMQADRVDGFDADATPTANNLLPLDAAGQFPASAIPSVPPGGPAGGDLTGTYPDPAIAADAVTAPKIAPDVLSSIDGVSNDAGDVDLIAGANVTITPDDAANTITIDAAGGGGGDITSVWPADATLTGGGDAGDVTLAVANPLELTGSSTAVITGVNTSTDGSVAGVLGSVESTAPGGYSAGVRGVNNGTGYNGIGVYGSQDGSGWGVFGRAMNGLGVYGYNSSSGNTGYLGGSDYGAQGYNSGSDNWGCLGSPWYGAYGEDGDGNYGYVGSQYYGVRGLHTASGNGGFLGGSTFGVYGVASSGTDPGVLGVTGSGSDYAAGVLGQVDDTTPGAYSAGVRGINDGTDNLGIGVYGSQDGSGWGVYGTALQGIGVRGDGASAGGYFRDTDSGNYCSAGTGIYKVAGSGASAFVQNHPRDNGRVIVYTAPEGDEVATYTRGSARLVAGEARVLLGETFKWVTNPDIGLTAHLTPRGKGTVLFVESLTTEQMVVRAMDGFPDDVVFDYVVYGLRIGFEEVSIVQEKQEDSYIPSMEDHREAYAKHPDLRQYTALERFDRMRVGVGETEPLDLNASQALRSAIQEYDSTIHGPSVDSGGKRDRADEQRRRLEEEKQRAGEERRRIEQERVRVKEGQTRIERERSRAERAEAELER